MEYNLNMNDKKITWIEFTNCTTPFPMIPRKPLNKVNKWGMINDADYVVTPLVDGKRYICPIYRSCRNMYTRAYDPKFHEREPNYKDCEVDKAFESFMSFREWMTGRVFYGKDGEKLELDKDILVPDNKIYSPDNCVFILAKLNKFLTDSGATRGKHPTGVSWHESTGKYTARCRNPATGNPATGKPRYIGLYDTVSEARIAYLTRKIEYFDYWLAIYKDNLRVTQGLLLHRELFKQKLIKNIKAATNE